MRKYNVTTDEFRNLTQSEQVSELFDFVLTYCQDRKLEINFENCKSAFNLFSETVSDTSYLEERVLNDLEI